MAIISKNDQTLKEDQRFVKWIPVKKARNFKILFDRVKGKVGGYKEAQKVTGLSNNNADLLNKGKISEATAKRIYNAYLKHCVDT